jgi:hypothetical protein
MVERPVRPRRFAPLGPSSKKTREAEAEGIPRLRGIVFDVDGTLCEYFYSFAVLFFLFWD